MSSGENAQRPSYTHGLHLHSLRPFQNTQPKGQGVSVTGRETAGYRADTVSNRRTTLKMGVEGNEERTIERTLVAVQ